RRNHGGGSNRTRPLTGKQIPEARRSDARRRGEISLAVIDEGVAQRGSVGEIFRLSENHGIAAGGKRQAEKRIPAERSSRIRGYFGASAILVLNDEVALRFEQGDGGVETAGGNGCACCVYASGIGPGAQIDRARLRKREI